MFLKSFAELPVRKRVGIVAIVLGLIAIMGGNPVEKFRSSINIKELSQVSVDEISKVSVEKLADEIIKSKFDYRLIDLRASNKYEKYNIPSSENILVADLLNSDLASNDNIVLYSDNDIESTQAWFLLRSSGFKGVTVLKGGLTSWQNNVLFPACTCGDSPSKEQLHKHAKLAEVSKYFGGKIKTVSTLSGINNVPMPTIKAPKKITLKKTKGKRKREGC